jgi:hypothetical protein
VAGVRVSAWWPPYPEDGIPRDLLDRAECVIVVPSVKKLALGIGGSYGRGAMVCRGGATFEGPWGPPSMFALEGVSFGFQLGGTSTDFVLTADRRLPAGVVSGFRLVRSHDTGAAPAASAERNPPGMRGKLVRTAARMMLLLSADDCG